MLKVSRLLTAQPAFHGTPHDFDEFSSDFLGAGEGNFNYGKGFYFAGAKAVGIYYKDKLVEGVINYQGKPICHQNFPDKNTLAKLNIVRRGILNGEDPEDIILENPFLNGLRPTDFSEPTGKLYEVEIPDDGPYLLWDEPLNKQPQAVLMALVKNLGDELKATMRGSYIYNLLARKFGGDDAASDYLDSLGIVGTQYLDGKSREVGSGTYDYVVFNAKNIRVLQKT